MRRSHILTRPLLLASRVLAMLLTAAVVIPSFGCVGAGAHLLYVIQGNPKVPAECDALKGKRVAVVCVSEASLNGSNDDATLISRQVGRMLATNVKNIDLIPYEEVENWIDKNDWDQMDYKTIGRGVDAEMLVTIDLSSFRFHENSTIYLGKANLGIKVFDMKKGRSSGRVFEKSLPEIEYPPVGHGVPVSGNNEQKFHHRFITYLAENVATLFYDFELRQEFAHSNDFSRD